MRPQLELRILELTKERKRLTLDELTAQLRGSESTHLTEQLIDLNRDGLVGYAQGVVEVDADHRMRVAERLIQSGYDPQRISRFLDWQEFENFAEASLQRNGFGTLKHFVFKGRVGRREIDLVAWSDTFLLLIDCKHWSRGLSPSQAKKVARAQVDRATSLAEIPELLARRGITQLDERKAIPMIFCLGTPRQFIVDGVPVVAVSKLVSFLQGVSPVGDGIRMIPFKVKTSQSTLM